MPLVHFTHLQCCLESEGTLCLREGTEIKSSKYGQITGLYGCTTERTVGVASNKIRREVFWSDTNLFLVLIFTVAVVNIQFEAHDFFT